MANRVRFAVLCGIVLVCISPSPVLAVPPPQHTLPTPPVAPPGDKVTPPSDPAPQGDDVNVSDSAGVPSGDEAEVSIDINPTNPLNQVIVGHAPGFATMNTFFTTDGGQTWTLVALGNGHDGITSTFRFDPTLAFDDDGNLYVGYGVRSFDGAGNQQETVVVCRSTDGGQTYPQCTQVSTAASIPDGPPGNDKWHLATGPDPSDPNQQNVYIAWTQNIFEGPSLDQRLVVSASTDGGANFTAPVIIADDAIGGIDRALFADPAVGPNGDLYVSWHDFDDDEILIDVSTDAAGTWGTDEFITAVDFSGLFEPIPPQPDRQITPCPTLDVDRSAGAFDGRLYITYNDFVGGSDTDTDVFVRFSDDGGVNWSGATTVNDDGGSNSQFLPWLDVDQRSGKVNLVWYDARNDVNNQMVEVFHAVSEDGGATFEPNTLVSDGQSNQSTSNPSRWGNNFLEYIGVTSLNCIAYMVWADNSTSPGDLDYFTDHVSSDEDAPVIACPADITVECSEHGGTPASDPAIAAFLNGASATDTCDPDVGITNDAPGFFPLGMTTVTFTATDDSGNQSSCSATVTVQDTTTPVITCPLDITVECTTAGGTPADDPQLAPFFAGVSATDICDADPVITNDAPPLFPLGMTTVTFTATDDSGNQSSCSATVTVEDTTPPTISVTLSRYELWPPNHKLVTITATVEISDICDPNPTFVLTSITSDEPDNGLGDGDRPDDIQGEVPGTPDTEFQLRSERQGIGDGREYTIVYTATDESGNTATDTDIVTVPHDQGGFAGPANGFNETGTDFTADATTYTLVVLSTADLDARTVDGATALVGNHMGVIAPIEYAFADADGDQRIDLRVSYEVDLTEEFASMQDDEGTYPVGFRYETFEGQGYWLPDIFMLGPPIENPSTGVPGEAPGIVNLWRPQPNPFSQAIRVAYEVGGGGAAAGEPVEISIFNVAGQRVRNLRSGFQASGRYETIWDGRDHEGVGLPAGVYFYRIVVGGQQVVRRVTLLR